MHLDRIGKGPRLAIYWTLGVIAALIATWVIANILLANPRYGTPTINWGLRTFADKTASVQSGQLEKPFSRNVRVSGLDWPERASAEAIGLTIDYFGWLPNRPWTTMVRVRDAEFTVPPSSGKPMTFQPQDYVDRIDAKNILIRFTRRDEPRELNVISASGSFARGTVKAEAQADASRLTFDGLRRQGGGFGGRVTATGDNLKRLAEFVGASAPDTPPFSVSGDLSSRTRVWTVTDLSGTVGDSDIGGEVEVDLNGDKPFLKVDLTSQELDFDDLGVVFGIPVGTGGGETVNDEQRKAKRVYDASARLIPDARIDFSRLGAVDGDISFVAEKVVDAPAGITALTLKGELRDRILDFERARVQTASGDLDAKVRIDAQRDPAFTQASGVLENVAINRVIPTPLIRGTMNGSFALDLTGSGFREAFGTATGEVGVWSTNSELANIATEAAGLDIGEILLILATSDSQDREYTKSTCLAANLAVADGRATISPAVIDNPDSLILATGFVNLKTEQMQIEVFSEPKDISLGKLFGDIRVGGTLRNPDVSALGAETVVQAGLSGLLSTLAGPLAALPFIELGGGPDAPCAQLNADARNAGQFADPTLRQRAPKERS